MNIKQLINAIIDLDNENKALKNKLSKYEEKTPCKVEAMEQSPLDKVKEEIYLIGLKKSFDDWYTVFNFPEIFNKNTRQFISTSSWIENITLDEYGRKHLPKIIKENLSDKQIFELYIPYFIQKYDELKRKKQGELMQEAKESSEY